MTLKKHLKRALIDRNMTKDIFCYNQSHSILAGYAGSYDDRFEEIKNMLGELWDAQTPEETDALLDRIVESF